MRTLLLALIALCLPLTAAAQDRPDLHGVVKDEAGAPVANATVYIWTAGVKRGYSTYCPSCYADCGRSAATTADGAFTIPSLDPELIFRLLAVAEGHQPTFLPGVDPVKGEPAAITLPRRQPPSPDSGRVLTGRVVDKDGQPVIGAAVSPNMVYWNDENGRPTGRGGAVEGLDPVAITNARGVFELAYKDATTKWDIDVEARGFAKQALRGLATEGSHTITILRGSTISGRLVHNGEPVPNAQMGISHTDRLTGRYLGHDLIGTDENGHFSFVNVPHGATWCLYSIMDSTRRLGATPYREVRVAADEEIIDAGDVALEPGFTLRGRVVLPDLAPIPSGMRVSISHDMAWDTQTLDLPPDGSFEFVGLSRDNYSIFTSVKGYRLSRSNPHLSWSIEGLIDRDIDGFIVLLEEGKEDFQGLAGGKFKNVPIKGATLP